MQTVTFLPFPFCCLLLAANLYRWPRNAILHDLSLLCKENVDRAEQALRHDHRPKEIRNSSLLSYFASIIIKEKVIYICMHTFMYIIYNIFGFLCLLVSH